MGSTAHGVPSVNLGINFKCSLRHQSDTRGHFFSNVINAQYLNIRWFTYRHLQLKLIIFISVLLSFNYSEKNQEGIDQLILWGVLIPGCQITRQYFCFKRQVSLCTWHLGQALTFYCNEHCSFYWKVERETKSFFFVFFLFGQQRHQ
jgi:hypothetical protein